ncbi:transposase [Kocuria arenosa]
MSNYPPELRKQTVPLVLEGNRSTREMARELGINQKTLRN